MSRGRIYLQVLLLYISLKAEFSKRSRTREDVRVLGQFDISDSIEKIWYTCHLCWCSTLIIVNSIVRYLAQFWGHLELHGQKIWFLIMFFCLVGYFTYLNSLSILLLYLEAQVSKNLGVQEQGNGQCVVWLGWGSCFQHCLISSSCHCRRVANWVL
jgi:hypothetical protein